MQKLAHWLKPYRLPCGLVGIAIALAALAILRFYNDALTSTERASTIGLFGISGWLLTPFIIYLLILEDRDKYYFWITVYPKFFRIFTAYGWLFAVSVFTYFWGALLLGKS
jgi:hypothetical protein